MSLLLSLCGWWDVFSGSGVVGGKALNPLTAAPDLVIPIRVAGGICFSSAPGEKQIPRAEKRRFRNDNVYDFSQTRCLGL